jgi:hypothetical protein
MLAVLVIIASGPAQAIGPGESLVVTEDPFDVLHRYQPIPGELDLETLEKTLVWKAVNRSVTTPILVEDLDRDGMKEIVFGLDTGKVIALELITNETVLDIKVTNETIEDLVVGNVDGDDADEIVFTSSEGIYCYDFGKEKLKWSNPMEIFDSEINLVATGSENDDPVKHEIVLLWSDGSYTHGTNHHVARLSAKGDLLWSSDLMPLVSATGLFVSSLVLDLDGDGTLEVFVNDYRWDAIGSGGIGRNIWILNATSGTLKRSMAVGLTNFASPPMPLIAGGETRVVIGLDQGFANNSLDLLIFNGSAGSHRLLDVHNGTDRASWKSLAFFPGPSGGTMVMRSGWRIHTFSWDEPAVNATHPGSHSGPDDAPVVCDIDGDGVMEILAPGGGIWIIDSESMQMEAQITQERFDAVPSRATNIRLTVADVDDDQRSEVIFGYYDNGDAETAYIFLLGGLDDQTEDDTPTEGRVIGWSIILFVVGANIVLIALLIRDWRRNRD